MAQQRIPPPIGLRNVLSDEELKEAGGSVTDALKKKREEGQAHLKETGSMPPDWPLGVAVFEHGKTCGGRPPKFASVDVYMEKAKRYFLTVQEEGEIPTLNGLVLHMGFSNISHLCAHARRHPEFRYAHATLMTLLELPLEYALHLTGVNTKGIEFRLKNIPSGWEPTDPMDTPTRYNWKDRRQAEVVGLDGAALMVSTEAKPEEVYQEMMKRGSRLQPEQAADALDE